MEIKDAEDKINVDTKKKLALGTRLKTLFTQNKIEHLDTPDKIESYIVENFRRGISGMAKNVADLYEELRN